jgi:hypothetical protein
VLGDELLADRFWTVLRDGKPVALAVLRARFTAAADACTA